MLKLALSLAGVVISTISPEFKTWVIAQLPAWEEKARETKGKGDDLLVNLLKALFT